MLLPRRNTVCACMCQRRRKYILHVCHCHTFSSSADRGLQASNLPDEVFIHALQFENPRHGLGAILHTPGQREQQIVRSK